MNMDFYWAPSFVPEEYRKERDSVHQHIGNRASGGLMCADCGVPQVKTWMDVHTPQFQGKDHKFCPGCGQNFSVPFFTFTWTMPKHRRRLQAIADEEAKRYRRFPVEDWSKHAERAGRAPVVDENGAALSATEFLQIIDSHWDLFSSL